MLARVLVAAAPKSGSTFFSRILSHLLGLPIRFISDAYKGGEHELSIDRLKGLDSQSFIAHMHTRCSIGTSQRIATFQLRPIVTVRNIFDTVISMGDHIRQADWNMPRFASPMTMAYCPARLKDAPDEEMDAFVVDFIVPWYFSFLASWQAYARDIPYVRYEELIEDPVKVVCCALQRTSIVARKDAVSTAVEKAKGDQIRFNVGIVGRGRQVEETMGRRIRELARFFPDADFSALFTR